MSKSDLIDLTLRLHAETDKAILVSDDGDRDKAVWIPKSQAEIEPQAKGIVIVTVSEWLATDKRLV